MVGDSQPVLAGADMGGAQSHTSGVEAASAGVGDADIEAFLADVLRGEGDDAKRTLVVSMPPHLLDEHCLQVDEERATFVRALLDGAVPMDRVTAVTVRTRPALAGTTAVFGPALAAYTPIRCLYPPSLRLVGWLEGVATMFLAYV